MPFASVVVIMPNKVFVSRFMLDFVFFAFGLVYPRVVCSVYATSPTPTGTTRLNWAWVHCARAEHSSAMFCHGQLDVADTLGLWNKRNTRVATPLIRMPNISHFTRASYDTIFDAVR